MRCIDWGDENLYCSGQDVLKKNLLYGFKESCNTKLYFVISAKLSLRISLIMNK